MKRLASYSLLILLSLMLFACGSKKKPTVDEPEMVVPEVVSTPQAVINHAVGNPAVMAIWERAEAARKAQDLEGAIAHLERAIRIDANDAVIWTRMAELRLLQGKYIPAENIAIKSNRLNADANRLLAYRNWLIIANAREQAGDAQGAQQAYSTARTYQ